MPLRWFSGRFAGRSAGRPSAGGRHRAGVPGRTVLPGLPAVAGPPLGSEWVPPPPAPGGYAVRSMPAVRLTFADGSEVAFDAHSAGGRPFVALAEVLLHRS